MDLGDVEGMPVVLAEDILGVLKDGRSCLEGSAGTHTVDACCAVLLDGDLLGGGLLDDGLQDGGLLGGVLLDGGLLVCHLILDRLNLLVSRPE